MSMIEGTQCPDCGSKIFEHAPGKKEGFSGGFRLLTLHPLPFVHQRRIEERFKVCKERVCETFGITKDKISLHLHIERAERLRAKAIESQARWQQRCYDASQTRIAEAKRRLVAALPPPCAAPGPHREFVDCYYLLVTYLTLSFFSKADRIHLVRWHFAMLYHFHRMVVWFIFRFLRFHLDLFSYVISIRRSTTNAGHLPLNHSPVYRSSYYQMLKLVVLTLGPWAIQLLLALCHLATQLLLAFGQWAIKLLLGASVLRRIRNYLLGDL